MIPSDTQIANEIGALPGLGRMQAINRIRSRQFLLERRRAGNLAPVSLVTSTWVQSPARLVELLAMPRTLTADEMAELTAFESAAGLIDAPVARTQESF